MSAETTSRRERLRRATVEEIHASARKLLVTEGSAAVTMNAVARQVGMSGPALYHYYASHEDLVGAVTADFFRELAAAMERARDAAADASTLDRLLSACRAMRTWAVAHPAEFGWIFAGPIAPPNRQRDSPRFQAAQGFEQVLLDLTVELWQSRRFAVPDLAGMPESLREQLTAYSAAVDGRLPPEAVHVYLTCWIRLYGLLCMEVLHQLDFAFSDVEPVFEDCLRDLARMLAPDDRA
jgi:AcrR family transcriptional regulator